MMFSASPHARAAAAVAIAAATFLLGVASPAFHNDHFDSLARARQLVVTGQDPVFESLDWGRPLQIYLSAAFQYVSGNTLLGEAILTVAGIALSVAFVFLLSAEITGSSVVGVLASLGVLWIHPRLYNWPKLLAPTVGLWLIWRFMDRPVAARAAAVGVWTGLSFLLRHDLGVYVGLASALAFGLRWWRDSLTHGARMLGIFSFAAALTISPYLWSLATHGFLGSEGQRGISNLLNAATVTWRPFHLRWEAPIQFERVALPVIKIRWRDDMTKDERVDAEHRLALTEPHDYEAPRSWSYRVERFSLDDLRRLVNDPDVEDTAFVDRSRLEIDEPWLNRLGRAYAIFRLRPAAWLATRHNAETWLYDLFAVGVLVAVLLLLFGTMSRSPEERMKAWALVAMSSLPLLFLIRHNLDSRLADAAPLSFVLVAWLLYVAVTFARRLASLGRALVLTAVAIVILFTWGSLTIVRRGEPVRGTIHDLRTLPTNLPHSIDELSKRPIDIWAPEGSVGVRRLARWLLECTSSDDRVMVVGYYPEVSYYSERAFAGGTPFFHSPYFTDVQSQDRIVAQMQRERIPVVIAESGGMLENGYPRVAEYVYERFQRATETDFGGGQRFEIFVNRASAPPKSDGSGLPCFK